ncbi:hypothetical protein TSAR_005533, partial [Trichomalopsis sarcophagae]
MDMILPAMMHIIPKGEYLMCHMPHDDEADELHDDLVERDEKVDHELAAGPHVAGQQAEAYAEDDHAHDVGAVPVDEGRLEHVAAPMARALADEHEPLLHVRRLDLLEARLHEVLRHHVSDNVEDGVEGRDLGLVAGALGHDVFDTRVARVDEQDHGYADQRRQDGRGHVSYKCRGTCDQGGDDERQYEHLEGAHQDLPGEADEHDGLGREVAEPAQEAEEAAQQHAEDRQDEQQVLPQPDLQLRRPRQCNILRNKRMSRAYQAAHRFDPARQLLLRLVLGSHLLDLRSEKGYWLRYSCISRDLRLELLLLLTRRLERGSAQHRDGPGNPLEQRHSFFGTLLAAIQR